MSDRYGTGLEPDPTLLKREMDPPIASTRHHVVERPVVTTDNLIRCQGKVALTNGTHKVCNKLLANMASRPWEITCVRCKHVSQSLDLAPGTAGATSPTPAP